MTSNRRRTQSGAGRPLWAVFLILAGLLGGWLVLKVSVANAFRGPAAMHFPLTTGNGHILLDHVMIEAEQTGGRLPEARQQEAAAVALRIPLAEEPFLVLGLKALHAGDAPQATRLLDEARARNPRLRLARLHLLDLHFRRGEVQEAATEVAVLSRLIPEASLILVPEIARIARDRRFSGAVRQALHGDQMLDAVLAELVRTGAEPDLVLEMAAGQPRSAEPPAWHHLIVDRFVQQGEVARARALWLRLTPRAEAEPGLLYDPTFEGLPGVPPFNWAFREQPAGAAGPIGQGTLEVAYYGREAGELARQMLLLGPGAYRLSFEAEGDAAGETSRIEWNLACAAGGQTLMSLPLRNVTYSPRAFSADFSVPAGCQAQWLTLTGVPAEFPDQQLVRLRNLELRQASAR